MRGTVLLLAIFAALVSMIITMLLVPSAFLFRLRCQFISILFFDCCYCRWHALLYSLNPDREVIVITVFISPAHVDPE